jgi:molybdopterin molybdotransferase
VQTALRQLGAELDFWKIRMRPGKPMMFGRLGELPVLALPGNPVSALVCAVLFLRPAIDRLQGRVQTSPRFERARLGSALPANGEREDYLRAKLSFGSSGPIIVDAYPVQDSSMLRTLAQSDALIRRLPFAPPANVGEEVETLRLDAAAGF